MDTKNQRQKISPPTVIILTLPHMGMFSNCGTLLIQRGDLAHMSQFPYTTETDFTAVIQQAIAALAVVESDPLVIPETPQHKTAPSPAASPEPPEPVIQVPTKTKKSTTTVPARCLRIVGGETDGAAQAQAGLESVGVEDTPSGRREKGSRRLGRRNGGALCRTVWAVYVPCDLRSGGASLPPYIFLSGWREFIRLLWEYRCPGTRARHRAY